MSDFTAKQGESGAVWTETLEKADGTAPDLTNCTAALTLRALSDDRPVALTGVATSSSNGTVSFAFSAADLARAGEYQATWLVTDGNNKTLTYPRAGYYSVSVEENLTTVGGQQLVSLPAVKDHLNIDEDDRAHDAKLVGHIEAVRPLIENIVGPVIPQVFEEWHDGGQTFIMVRHRPSRGPGTTPVLDLVGVSEYRGSIEYPLKIVADPVKATTYSVHLDIRLGKVTRRVTGGGVTPFSPGAESVHVVYRAGQSVVPANVRLGALEAIRVNYQTTQQVGRGRRTVTDDFESGPPLGFFMPRRVKELLAPTRRAPSIA